MNIALIPDETPPTAASRIARRVKPFLNATSPATTALVSSATWSGPLVASVPKRAIVSASSPISGDERDERVEERRRRASGLGRRGVVVQDRASSQSCRRPRSDLSDDAERRRRRGRLAVLRRAAGEREQPDDRGRDAGARRPSAAVRPWQLLPQIGSRTTGQVMQCPPPRPLPSSKPSIVTTSTPASRIFAIV